MSAPTYAIVIASAEKKFTEIALADGNLVTYQREAMYALQSVAGSKYLQECSHDSLRNAVINIASVGLSLNPAMKLAYLVPRDGKACLDISYIGLIKIATDSGSVAAVKAEIVRANDNFEYTGPFAMPAHKFNPFDRTEDRGEVIGAYAIARLANGMTQIETLSLEEIRKIRDKSKAKSGPWFDWFEEMVKKSVIKRASKMWPRTDRLATAEAVLNEHEGIEMDMGDAERIEPTITQPQPKRPALSEPSAEAGPIASPPAPAGMIKLIRSKLANGDISEAEACAQANVEKLEDLTVAAGNVLLAWIANPE